MSSREQCRLIVLVEILVSKDQASASTPHDTVTPIVQPPTVDVGAEIHRLSQELWDTRQEITVSVAKEMRIMDDLRRLQYPAHPAPVFGNAPTDSDFAGAPQFLPWMPWFC
jgi:hypothetical protein